MNPPAVESYLRELAHADPDDSKRTVVMFLARPVAVGGLGLSRATVYRMIQHNDAGEHARAILDALDRKRARAGVEPTTIEDFRNLTTARLEVSP